MACCGSFAPARRGTICRAAIRLTKRVIAASSCGSAPGAWKCSCNVSQRICDTAARSISPKPWSTPRSAGRKKGALLSALRAAGKGAKSWQSANRHGLPIAVHVASASPYEPHLIPATLDARFLADLPTRLIGDRGYDSDALDKTLMTTYGVEMIAAHRRGRRQLTQDGRSLRRARRRWKIERLFAWLHNSRRVVTRWDIAPTTFLACFNSRVPGSSSEHL